MELDGTSETLAVDAQGEETKFAVTIDRCVKIDSQTNATTELIPKDGVLIAENENGETKLSLKDAGKLSDDAAAALRVGISVHTPGEPNDDGIFGAGGKRKSPDDTWPVNTKALAKVFSKSQASADEKDISGTVKLVAAAVKDGVPCLHIEAEFTVKNLKVPGGEKIEQTDGTFRGAFAGMFPQDLSLPPIADSQAAEMKLSYKGTTSTGQPLTLNTKWQRMIESKVTPITPAKQ